MMETTKKKKKGGRKARRNQSVPSQGADDIEPPAEEGPPPYESSAQPEISSGSRQEVSSGSQQEITDDIVDGGQNGQQQAQEVIAEDVSAQLSQSLGADDELLPDQQGDHPLETERQEGGVATRGLTTHQGDELLPDQQGDHPLETERQEGGVATRGLTTHQGDELLPDQQGDHPLDSQEDGVATTGPITHQDGDAQQQQDDHTTQHANENQEDRVGTTSPSTSQNDDAVKHQDHHTTQLADEAQEHSYQERNLPLGLSLNTGQANTGTEQPAATVMEEQLGNDNAGSVVEQDPNLELPEQMEHLPKLDNLIETLDGGESDLETVTEPPHLFQRPEQEPNYQTISDLQTTLQDEAIDPYVDRFDDSIRDEVLMIGNISLEEVQVEERRLRDEHIAYQQQEMVMARQRQEAILMKEEKAKEHVVQIMKDKRKDLARREELNLQRERLLQNHLHRAFKRSENQLKRSLALRKGEVKTMYGDLMMADGEYGGSKGRRWKVDWNKSPQPIQIKMTCFRGVKDKLPGGRYVLMVSLYDRLGGHVLRWSNLRGQEWGGATLPLNHDGNFFNVEINIDQSVFTVLPAKSHIKPGMVLLFELFLLRGTLLPIDKVVSWGVFPICDAQFGVLQGRYKSPMLRGEFDPRIEKHEVIEKLMASDLDHWMGNLYFEIIKLPRYIAGQKEYEVELQFSSQLINFPDRVKGAEEAVDGEQPIPGSSLTLASQDKSVTGGSSLAGDKRMSEPGTSHDSIHKKSISDSQDKMSLSEDGKDSGGIRFRGGSATVIGSRKMMKKSDRAYLGDSDSDGELTEDDGFRAVRGEPGLYYKHHTNPVATDYMRHLYTMLPKTALLNQKKKRKKLTHIENLDTHTFSVQSFFSTKGHLERKGHEKIQYVTRQARSEMGLSQWRSREFWTLVLLLCLVFFIRMYLHYIGQWAFLSIINIPVSSFQFYPYTVSLNYQSSLLHTREEVAVVFLGPATNVIILLMLVLVCWLTQRTIGNFPDLFCKFIMVYAILTFLDPILIAIVDAPLGRYNYEVGDEPIADAAKLYYHFYRIHNNGLMGILLTVPIYLSLMFLTFVIFYMYFLRLHNNGRMLDIYHRLHAPEDEFFVPYDLEMSNQELAYICNKAEQWRGEEGERRKVAVYDYIWAEQQDADVITPSSSDEITTHISIHTLHLDGLREMYRHFLKLPDGAIVEVFGEMGVSGIDKDLRTALQNEDGPISRPTTVGGIGSQDLLNIPSTAE